MKGESFMNKEDWIRKLTSRKFWAAVAGFVTGLIVFLKNPTGDPQAVTALIMAFGSLIAYIVGEGLVDVANAHADQTVTYFVDDPEEKPPEG
jgi:hypothetical protein